MAIAAWRSDISIARTLGGARAPRADHIQQVIHVDDAVTGDGIVNVDDLLYVIGAWGPCPAKGACDADIAPPGGDGHVNVDDLLMVIANWG